MNTDRSDSVMRRPLKILFAGIDGSGKTTCLDSLLSRLDRRYRVLKIGPSCPRLFFRGRDEKLFNSFLYEPTGLGGFLHKRHLRGILVVSRFLSNFAITQYARLRDKADIIMYETDTVIHPSVYIAYYHPLTKRLKNNVRFQIINRLFGPRKNFVIFYLDTDPIIAMDRIQKRNTTFDRHENIEDLRTLKTELDQVVEVALKSGVDVVKIDTNGKTRESVCHDMQRVLKGKFYLNLSLFTAAISIVW
jgi:thymidylate kinase